MVDILGPIIEDTHRAPYPVLECRQNTVKDGNVPSPTPPLIHNRQANGFYGPFGNCCEPHLSDNRTLVR